MGKESKESPKKSGHKVIAYSDYLKEAADLVDKGGYNGMTDKWNIAVSLLHDKNEVIRAVQKAGETRYVCKV